jgi:ribosomal protein S18 acetylase RimI-like enzyme
MTLSKIGRFSLGMNNMYTGIKGYEDIHQEEPYIESWIGEDVAYIDMIYVPPAMRSTGVGASLVSDWLTSLDKSVKRVKLKAATLGGSSALKFWSRIGFVKAYSGDFLYDEIEDALVLGVNGYSTPVPEQIMEGDEYRHWTECAKDKLHFKKNPQILLIKSH